MLFALMIVAQAPVEQTPWWHCLEKEVAMLEPSRSEPADIAVAAMDACRSLEPKQLGPALLDKVRSRMVPKLVARVVQIRSVQSGS